MSKCAIITGIIGQDSVYLAQLLLEKGYRVLGAYRRANSVNFWRIEELGTDKRPAVLPAQPLWRGQAVCALDDDKLP